MLQKKKKLVVSLVETHLLKLKAREIDLKARDNARKEQEGQERLDLDKDESNDEPRKSRK